MKLFKFRVFDKTAKCYISERSIFLAKFLIDTEGKLFEYDRYDHDGLSEANLNRYVIEYSSGRYDEYGQEIYEGDIVKVNGKIPSFTVYYMGITTGIFLMHAASKDVLYFNNLLSSPMIDSEGMYLGEKFDLFKIIGNIQTHIYSPGANPELTELLNEAT